MPIKKSATTLIMPSEPEPGSRRAFLDKTQKVVTKGCAEAGQKGTALLKRHKAHLVSEDFLHLRNDVPHAVGKTLFDRGLAHPDLSGEQVFVAKPRAAPLFHVTDEAVVDLGLDFSKPGDVLGFFGLERVKHALRLAGRVEPPFDTVARDEVLEPEPCRYDADRTDDRVLIDPDLVGGGCQPVPAGGCHILDKGIDLEVLFIRKPADPRRDQ